MTKQEKQKIDDLENEIAQLKVENARLRDDTESEFSASSTYARMRDEIAFLRAMSESSQNSSTFWHQKYDQIRAAASLPDTPDEKDRQIVDLTRQVTSLSDQLEKTKKHLAFQQSMAEGKEPSADSDVRRIGRPRKITETEKKQIRSYRRQGYSIREIADIMGYAVGTVQGICKGVKVDPEVVKEHRKHRK